MRLVRILRTAPLLLACTAPSAWGQFQPPNAEELRMTSDPKAPAAPAVYLYREETSDDPHHFATVYARIKVLTEAGKQAATVQISHSGDYVYHATGDNSSRMATGDATHWDAPSINHVGEDRPNDVDSFNVKPDIGALEARTIHPDGTVVPLKGSPAELLKVKRGRNQVDEYSFTLPDVEVGSILEYRYQIRYDRFESAPDWHVQKEYFTHKAHFSFVPDERFSPKRNEGSLAGVGNMALRDVNGEALTDVRSAAILPPNASVKMEASGIFTVDITDVPPLPNEPFGPPIEGRAYEVAFFYLPTPDEKEYWQKEMGYWTKKVNQYIAPTAALQSLVKETVSAADTPLDKAKKLYAVAQNIDNTDFNRDGEPDMGSSWIPSGRVEKVLQDKKGTSNQIAFLYLALTRIAGLNARPERIGSRSHRIFSPQFRRTSQLDSVLIAVEVGGQEITLDPGAKMAPFQTLHWAHAAAAGIAVGANGRVETIITPAQKTTDNMVLHVGSLNVNAQGSLSGNIKIAFLGQQALQLRQMALRTGAASVKEQIDRMIAEQLPQGVTAKVDHLANLDEPGKQLLAIVTVNGTLDTQTGGRLLLPRNLFCSRNGNPFPESNERVLPVDLQYPAQEQEQITYSLPAGYSVGEKPQDTVLKWADNAAYQSKSKVEGSAITSARVLARGFTLLASSEYGDLHDFYQKVTTADREQVVLSPAATANK